jgi:hypothetical protein
VLRVANVRPCTRAVAARRPSIVGRGSGTITRPVALDAVEIQLVEVGAGGFKQERRVAGRLPPRATVLVGGDDDHRRFAVASHYLRSVGERAAHQLAEPLLRFLHLPGHGLLLSARPESEAVPFVNCLRD